MVLALVLLLETANLACMRFFFIRHNGVDGGFVIRQCHEISVNKISMSTDFLL